MSKTIRIKLPTIEEVEFSLEVEQDHIPVKGNAIASGDNAYDRKIEDEIIERLNQGDVWAWCSVGVIAKWKGIEGADYLGACTYKNEKDFKQEGGYFDEMKQRAYDYLIVRLNALK